MKSIKVYGPGCKRCQTIADMVQESAGRLGIEIELEKVTDMKSIAMAGVMATPGLSVDGKLVHSGGLPKAADVDGWLSA